MGPIIGILSKPVYNPKLLNNLLASCSLINLDFLLPQTTQFDETIILACFF